MPDSKWLILTALAMEAKAITAACPQATVRVIGIRASRFDDSMLAGATGIILAGLAGGLDPQLKAGDVVIGARADLWP